MNSERKQPKNLIISLGIIQLFNGLSGLLGGTMLVSDPSGVSLQMKLEWLQGTPFENFLIPGIVLLLFVGLGQFVGALTTFFQYRHARLIAVCLGGILSIWILFQVGWIGYKSVLQPLYFILGAMEIFLGLKLPKTSDR